MAVRRLLRVGCGAGAERRHCARAARASPEHGIRRCLAVGLLTLMGCASALKEPAPVGAAGAAPDATVDVAATLAKAESAFAQRPEFAAVADSRELFLAAARADATGVAGLLGAMRASAWLIEHESDPVRRRALTGSAVQLGQWCERRVPADPECGYRLALAVGQQARERPATAVDGLKVMVSLLEQAAAAAPALDSGGPDRVLALVLLRAPGWPAGPGDSEAALGRARAAAGRAPDYPPNQLALAEALRANGLTAAARAAYTRAKTLAGELSARGDPDAAEWLAEAAKALAAF